MKHITPIAILLMLASLISYAQEPRWKTYTTQFDAGPATISLNMDLIYSPPKREFPFLLIMELTTGNCQENGLPKFEALETLNSVSEKVEEALSELTPNMLVGSFTYQCRKQDYFYTTDTTGVRQLLVNLFEEFAQNHPYQITLEADHSWETYREFLYPNDLIEERIANREILKGLSQEGDKLDEPRMVDHWLYFPHDSARKSFIEYAKSQGFKIKKTQNTKGDDYPFSVMISRRDPMDVNAISKLTLQLKNKAHALGGEYDGWETYVVKD